MSKLKEWWDKYFLTLELLTSLGISVFVFVWGEFFSGKVEFARLFTDNLINIYENQVAVFGTLLGFVITAVSIVLGYANDEKLAFIRQTTHYGDLWKVYKSAMRSLALATLTGFAGIILINDDSITSMLIYLNVFAVSLATLRLGRSIWALENIIGLITNYSGSND